ncbi:MAG: hypothetical protein ACYS8W_11095 [Planctomycetota bacterium]|jgi:hypothetical protein
MKMDRAYLNVDEGIAVCFWDAPSKEGLEELFSKAGASFENMTEVYEHVADSF